MVTHRSRSAAVGALAGIAVTVAVAVAGAGAGAAAAADLPGPGVVTMEPRRVLAETVVTPGVVRCVSIAGSDDVPEDATGVIVNVTTVAPTGVGYAVVFPDTSGDGTTAMPATSTVNFEAGRDVAASTFARLGPNGDLCYATRGAARTGLLLDVSGYVQPGSGVVLTDPRRLLDTRTPGVGEVVGPLAPRTPRTLQVAGRLGVPEDAESVVLNVTVAEVSSVGNLRVYPGGRVTETSSVNYAPGVDKANTTVAALDEDGRVSLYSDSDRPVQVVVDVLGWTEVGGSHVGVVPTRVLDTRVDAPEGEPIAPLEAGTVYSLAVRQDAVPVDATAVVLNVTAIQPSTIGHLRVYPGGPEPTLPPDVSSINYIPGRDIANLVVVDLPVDGSVNVYSDQPRGGTVDLAVDVVGYLTR